MYLLDTNVVSELRKARKADARVAAWGDSVDPASLFLSAMTLHELDIGWRRIARRDPFQSERFRLWVEQTVLPSYAGRILAADVAVCRIAARLQVPDPRPVADALIAATAFVHGLTVVTRNVADFASTGVAVLNPWSWQPSGAP